MNSIYYDNEHLHKVNMAKGIYTENTTGNRR